jgi:aryl-alcohol dehydrogenase-like predicted oxidoreductase
MKYNLLPKTDIAISEVSFGCMSLTASAAENDALISSAIEGGINLFDTADIYEKGENERLLGKALKGRRNNVLISSKVGNVWRADGSSLDWNPRKAHILASVEKSLERLQTDYLDLYLLHGGTIDDPTDEVIEAFERLKAEGKIRQYGISSIRPNVVRDYVKRPGIAAVMLQYSVLDRRPEEELLGLLLHNNIGILARGSLAGGLLAGKPATDYLEMEKSKVERIVSKIPSAETALRYVMDNPAITSAVVGIRTTEQLADAISGSDAFSLSRKEFDRLRHLWDANRYTQHR